MHGPPAGFHDDMPQKKQPVSWIDQHFRDAGWIIQDANALNLSEGLGVAEANGVDIETVRRKTAERGRMLVEYRENMIRHSRARRKP